MDLFAPATASWFRATFDRPTPVQSRGWPAIAAGSHTLLLAPTGSGKTLAAFLSAIDRCTHEGEPRPGVRVLYVSPLKALVYDIERNLRTPLAGIGRAAARLGETVGLPRVGVRTGDTSSTERQRLVREPPEILATTPESLYLMLGSQARETLRSVETVIVDEIHALVPSKRGAHLALSLERLSALADRDPQRIGLSATARPVETIARFLGGDREVEIVDATQPPAIDLRIVVTVPDMEHPPLPEDTEGEPGGPVLAEVARADGGGRTPGVWPSIYERVLAEIEAHRTTIVFVNSRGLCERLAQRLNELAEKRTRARLGLDDDEPVAQEELVRTHHGSLAQRKRRETEDLLKAGRIKGIVATSSLELGIDMASVDHVIMLESPGSVASGLQRIGRAGHGVGEVSRGSLVPKHRGDLLESTVVARRMRTGEIEPLPMPERTLDVLAQQIVAMVAVEDWSVDVLERVVKRAAAFRSLTRELLVSVLDMLAGRYPSHEFADLKPRLVWDRGQDELRGRRGAKMLSLISGGTIPDRGLYAVHLGPDGPRVGELDEEMVHETRAGHVITLGASSWRVLEITRDRVIVEGAAGEAGRLPFWKGDGPGRPVGLGRAVGAFLRDLDARDADEAAAWLEEEWDLDAFAAANLVRYVAEQRQVTGGLPTDRSITVERFRDELGDWRVCILTPFGSRVHAPWALALEARLASRTGFEVQALARDDGIVLRFADGEAPPAADDLIPDPDEVEDLVVEQLGHASLFAAAFRENASRALLLPRRRPGARAPLWSQRLRAQNLLAVAREYPSFPIVLETYRTCLRDVFDLPALIELLRAVRSREIAVHAATTAQASPFARSLVFALTAAYLYEVDAPLAERRAQALTLDRQMLRELLGHEDLRALLDAGAVDQLEAELQRREEGWRARGEDELHDVLRTLGDLGEREAAERADGDAAGWLSDLERAGRAVQIRIAGEARWIAAEDAAAYRDALGSALPPGLPGAFLEPVERPLRALVHRHARTRGPFVTADVASRLGLDAASVEKELGCLVDEEKLLRGDFRPGGFEPEWCDREVLRRLKQRTLALLRREVAPVDRATFARFCLDWHGVASPDRGTDRLIQALVQLEGVALSLADLERSILPARLAGFEPRELDEVLSAGSFVWIGAAPLGRGDGRIRLFRREQVAALREPPAHAGELDEPARAIVELLRRHGACFFSEIWSALREHKRDGLEDALWDLVWGGLVTNDSLDPLRSRRGKASRARRASWSRPAGGRWSRPAGGRWSLVERLFLRVADATEQAHARALMLLERHGVVGRAAAAVEELPGGFSGVYPVLRAMEEAGKVRRGYFVEELGGAQFAFPGAVDRLRTGRLPPESARATCLAAADPANAWGASLPWPEPAVSERAVLRRVPGARVVLVDGQPALYATRGGRQLHTFAAMQDDEHKRLALEAYFEEAARSSTRGLKVEYIDGEAAPSSSWAEAFRSAGFQRDYRSLSAWGSDARR